MFSGVRPTLTAIFVVLLVCTTTVRSAEAGQRQARKKPVKREQPAPAPKPQSAPQVLQPLSLEQLPAMAPQIIYSDGSLTIIAQNSTLGDILRAVRAKTGAVVDVPANANERVVSHVGPGPAREVLAALLNGSHFDYVLLGSAANPQVLERVVLIPKSSGGSEPNPSVQASANPTVYSPPQARMPMASVPAPEPAEDISDEEIGDEVNDSESDNLGDEQANQPAGQTQPNGQPAPRTPEQLLQELQRQQQQLQQQQGNPQGFPVPPGQPVQPQPEQPPE
jgi:hypothetical protein